MSHISEIKAREILDSRGNPTLEVDVILSNGLLGRAAVPSGASKGSREAFELRDNDLGRYNGLGLLKVIEKIRSEVAPQIQGMSVSNQIEIDEKLLEIDATANKTNLGGNTMICISMAVAQAGAQNYSIPLYKYISKLMQLNQLTIPIPMFNILNGGRHAFNSTDFQEFMLIPINSQGFKQSIRIGSEVYQKIKSIILKKGFQTTVGDEGGFAPNITKNSDAIDLICESIEKSGYIPGKDCVIGIDAAASEFINKDKNYFLEKENLILSNLEMIEQFDKWINKYPIVSIEDGLAEDDWEGWKIMTKKLGKKILLVGDDLYATNPKTIEHGISQKTSNAVLIKPNQIGTLKETFEAIKVAHNSNLTTIISHRSGETEDTFIADLAIGTNSKLIKSGAPARGERTAKYNRLLRIEESLQSDPDFVGQSNLSFN